jgi:hypothetical protein
MSRDGQPCQAIVSPGRQIQMAACCAADSGSVDPGSARCTTKPVCLQSLAYL